MGAERTRNQGNEISALIAVGAAWIPFLLFAQFGFLDRVKDALARTGEVERVMGAMGLAGFLGSLATGWLLGRMRLRRLLVAGFAGCALSALATLLTSGFAALVTVAALIGLSTAITTVGIAASLRELVSANRRGARIGLATGLAYGFCNIPPIFSASAEGRTIVAAIVSTIGVVAALCLRAPRLARPDAVPLALDRSDVRGVGFATLVASFMALVWLDSAAFAVVQQTPELKGATWSGARIATLGIVHLAAAIAAGSLIDRGQFRALLAGAFALLVSAFLVLTHSQTLGGFAGGLYAAGISLYSVALVACASCHPDGPGLVPLRWRAAILFGVAGWIGSAAGIGMVQDLHRIPAGFMTAAGVVVLTGWLLPRVLRKGGSGRLFVPAALFGIAGLLVATTGIGSVACGRAREQAATPEQRGRQVYIEEGCISCHSQYVRPNTSDVERWGPFRPIDRAERPPLIGNRRQGPDLLNVGRRRDPEWNRQHLIDPRKLSAGSKMPSYAHLFRDGSRGDDLVAYLASLGNR